MAETALKTVPTPPRIGLKQVAHAAGVSLATVSMALSDHPGIGTETKRRIWQLSAKMGYQPKASSRLRARSEKPTNGGRRTMTRVGFLMLGSNMQDPVNGTILQRLMDDCTAGAIGLQVAAISVPDLASAQDRSIQLAREVDGLVLMGYVNANVLNTLNAANVPSVVLGYTMTTPKEALETHTHCVCADELAMGQMATEVLIAAGHRRIAFVCETMPHGLSHWRWHSGYVVAHADAGIAIDPTVVQVTGKVHDNFNGVAEHLLSLRNPATAYVVPDARIGSHFLAAMLKRGHEVPRESIVIGSEPVLADRYGLNDYPMVEYPHQSIAAMGLRHLRQTYEDPSPIPTTLQVPFTFRNLPTPGTSR